MLFAMIAAGFLTAAHSATEPATEMTKTLLVLERGEAALASPTAEHRQVLNTVLKTLPAGAEDFIRNDITTFLKRAPNAVSDFACSPEFMLYRARQELGRIRDKLLNTNPQPAEPQSCYAVPFAVDLARPLKTLEIFGYDLDTQPLELFVVNSDDSFEDVSFALSRSTHYRLTVDLGPNGVKLSAMSRILSVAWGHIIRYSVSLIQPTTALCLSRIEEIPAGKTITYPPVFPGGKGRLSPGAKVSASTTLNYESNKIDATVCMTATDNEQGSTTFAGCSVEFVYTPEPERVIESVFGGLQSRISYTHLNQTRRSIEGKRDGPVSRWTVVIPGEPSAAGSETLVQVELRKIQIVSTAIENCLPPIAYMEARRMKSLLPGTLQRLNAQSKTISPTILKLRPRFARADDHEESLPIRGAVAIPGSGTVFFSTTPETSLSPCLPCGGGYEATRTLCLLAPPR